MALTALAGPALAAPVPVRDPALTYLEARAAELDGEQSRSALLFAALAEQSGDRALARKAISSAIGAGELPLALRLARANPSADLPIEAKLLLVADQLKHGHNEQAIAAASGGGNTNASFLLPLLRAWAFAERRDLPAAMAALDSAPANGLLAPFRDEQRALILLRFKRTAEAAPLVERALGAAGGRRARLRMVFADGMLRARDRQGAVRTIAGSGDPELIQRIGKGKPLKQRIDTPAAALSELLTAMAVDLSRGDKDIPIALLNVARHADPANSGAAIIQGLLLEADDRPEAALSVLRKVSDRDALAPQARNYEARLLVERGRFQEALAVALPLAQRRNAAIADYQRVGAVYRGMKRQGEAAEWFGRAIEAAKRNGDKTSLWPLYYERAVALQQSGRWDEAKQDLTAALALAPDEPAILNFLGYSKLERGEDLDDAEAMIRKASSLAPDEAAITDSLGWALFKRGRLPEAIDTLQRAAAKEADEAEIREHLGDALYSAGRHYEARFAWNAALITAEDDVAKRIRAKLQSGLTAANAAP